MLGTNTMKCNKNEVFGKIHSEIMKNNNFDDNDSKLKELMKRYKILINNDNVIHEWECNYWDSRIREVLIILYMIIAVFFLFTVLISESSNLNQFGMWLSLSFLLITTFCASMFCYPLHFKHKITRSGIFVSIYRCGEKIRRKLLIGLFVFSIVSAVLLLLFMGPMVFVGAGAGVLGVFSLLIFLKSDTLKEYALPWEVINFLLIDNENKSLLIQSKFYVVCEPHNFESVKKTIEDHSRDDISYFYDSFDIISGRCNEAIKKSKEEYPYLWKSRY